MGRIAQDAKNLILGNDGSDKEPVDFKTELQKAIKEGLITKADGTMLITSRTNCDKLAEKLVKNSEKEIINSAKEHDIEYDTPEEAKEALEQAEKKEKDKERKERKRLEEVKKQSLEQQIKESQNQVKAKMKSEKKLEELEIEKK